MQVLADGGVANALGFAAGGARGGIKERGEDVGLISAPSSTTGAAVFTTNQVIAAPVQISALNLCSAQTRGVVWNSGNAKCCTGIRGIENARRMCELAAAKIGCEASEILVCSTGIIGHQLPMQKVESALQVLAAGSGDEFSQQAARAAMTTDTIPKHFAAQTEIDGQIVTIGGQIKGVGMIGPNMQPMSVPQLHATLLAFLTTDAKIQKSLLQNLLERAVEKSFNSVTVDGDMSTNDTAILLASGAADVEITASNSQQFAELLEFVCIELAKKVARDGEGATKLVTVEVSGANSESDARQIALTIANSPLVKTAIFGQDPNWGRLAMAAGRAGIAFDSQQLAITIGGVAVFQNGEPLNFDLAQAEAAMSEENLLLQVLVGEGSASWTAWTCDFSYDYVKINAEYHT